MKSIFITGATGGLGLNAALWALRKGLPVHATGRKHSVLQFLQSQGAKVWRLDLANASEQEIQSAMRGCDTVWHCAALASPWGPFSDFYKTNVQPTARVYQAACTLAVARFVNISSPSIYFDYTARRDIPESFVASRYVNAYAETKAIAEQTLNNIALQSLTAPCLVHLRPRAIFGPYDQVLFPRLMQLVAQRNGVLPLPRGGSAVLDLTYVENVVHAMALASTTPVVSTSAYNVTNGEPVVLRDTLQELFLRQLGKPLTIKSMPYFLMDAAARASELIGLLKDKEPAITRYGIGVLAFDMTLDITKIKAELGYEPLVPMNRALQRTASWIAKNGQTAHV